MNLKRRKSLRDISDLIYVSKNNLENILFDEQSSYDNLPQSLQNSEMGEAMEDNIDLLEEAIDYLDKSIDTIGEVIN